MRLKHPGTVPANLINYARSKKKKVNFSQSEKYEIYYTMHLIFLFSMQIKVINFLFTLHHRISYSNSWKSTERIVLIYNQCASTNVCRKVLQRNSFVL